MLQAVRFGRTFVSTLSRPKAAAKLVGRDNLYKRVSTLSRPKAAGSIVDNFKIIGVVSTLSRPKAAGQRSKHSNGWICFNTQPPEGG